MPTKRTRRSRRRREPVSQHAWAWLTDAPPPPDSGDDDAFEFFLTGAEERHALWDAHRSEILTAWVKDKPGTRPGRWWDFDAPRQSVGTYPDSYLDGRLPEPRRRTGGAGTPKYEVLAYAPAFEFGIPVHFVEDWEVEHYNGRGQAYMIGDNYQDGDFKGIAYDPDDPPMFESQATYLDRHGLLTADERKVLGPDAFELEPVIFEEED